MTDEAYEFLTDVKEKKRTARGARHRKGHNGRKGCALPSDFLSKKQLAERNGPIMAVKLNEPMSWDEFKALPKTLQYEYLLNLRNTYNVSYRLIAKMFGVNPITVCRKFTELGVPKPEGTVSSKSKEYRERVAKWTEAMMNSVLIPDAINTTEEVTHEAELANKYMREDSSYEVHHATMQVTGERDDLYDIITELLDSMSINGRYSVAISINKCRNAGKE